MRVVRSGRLQRKSRKDAGFTLVELLIALFVFAIASLAIAAMTFMSIRGNAMTNQMSQATFLAQDKMEELLTFKTQLVFEAAFDPPSADNPDGKYTRSWVISGAGPTAGSRWFTVTVSWSDYKGNHHVTIRSLWRGV